MLIKLSYSICTASPWNHKYDEVGAYTLRTRKSPDELRAIRELDKEKGYKISNYRVSKESVFTVRGDTCYFLLGSWESLKEALTRGGEDYTVEENFDPDVMPEPDYSVLNSVELREGQAEALALLTARRCGMLCSTVSFGKSFIIRLLCEMYPTLNIVIICAMGQVIRQLYNDISKALPGQAGLLTADSANIDGKRIVCTTPQSSAKLHAELPQLVLVDECHSFGANASGQAVMRFRYARRFGFTATPIRNLGDYKATTALFGPVLQNFTFQDALEAGSVTKINYCMFPVDVKSSYLADFIEVQNADGTTSWIQEPDVPPTATRTGRRRKKELPDFIKNKLFYWNNFQRNKLIVDVFYRVREANPDIQILIMVQSIEHLIRLHQKLKLCAFCHGERGSLAKYNKKKGLENVAMDQYKQTDDDVSRVKGALSKGTLKYAISTSVLNAGVNISNLAVLIRCDAAVSGIPSVQIPGRLARLAEHKPCAYLIDFTDNFCTEAAGRAISREHKYKEKGWSKVEFEDMLNELRTRNTENSDCSQSNKEENT